MCLAEVCWQGCLPLLRLLCENNRAPLQKTPWQLRKMQAMVLVARDTRAKLCSSELVAPGGVMNPQICPVCTPINIHAVHLIGRRRVQKTDTTVSSRSETDTQRAPKCPLISAERRAREWKAATALTGGCGASACCDSCCSLIKIAASAHLVSRISEQEPSAATCHGEASGFSILLVDSLVHLFLDSFFHCALACYFCLARAGCQHQGHKVLRTLNTARDDA